jgi:hypothetical protein
MSKELLAKQDLERMAMQEIRAFPGCEHVTEVEVEYQVDEVLKTNWTIHVFVREGGDRGRIVWAWNLDRKCHRNCDSEGTMHFMILCLRRAHRYPTGRSRMPPPTSRGPAFFPLNGASPPYRARLEAVGQPGEMRDLQGYCTRASLRHRTGRRTHHSTGGPNDPRKPSRSLMRLHSSVTMRSGRVSCDEVLQPCGGLA